MTEVSGNDPISSEELMVVLMNMGGPQTRDDIEGFLRRLFNDRMIIRFPFAQSLFAELIIRLRLKALKERYQLIGGGSPILASSLRQVEALKAELARRGNKSEVTLCFNYTEPLPVTAVQAIVKAGKSVVLPLSMYPQYSRSTTGSNEFYLKQQLTKVLPQACCLQAQSYHLHDGYVQALADRIQETLLPGESLDDLYILFSAHGTPLYLLEEGDPYACQVMQTIVQVLHRLGRKEQWALSYQSAVGPIEWLKPSTEKMLKSLACQGVSRIVVVPISFVNDHIETLHEIDIEYRDMAMKMGFKDFRMSKGLECHPAFISALADCVENSLGNKKV